VASFTSAAACGWLRIASDNHWLTDVVAGAAVGTAVGLTLPGVVLHRASDGGAAVTMYPAPGGIALVF
jgi:membrane-associated phospholipid phosphatase